MVLNCHASKERPIQIQGTYVAHPPVSEALESHKTAPLGSFDAVADIDSPVELIQLAPDPRKAITKVYLVPKQFSCLLVRSERV